MITKKIEIIIDHDGLDSKMSIKASQGMARFEIIGALHVAIMQTEEQIKIETIKNQTK